MTGKFLLGWLLTTLFSCSIISDDHLDKLPDDLRVREVEIIYDRWVNNTTTYESKGLNGKLIRTGNKIEINWPADSAFLFLDKKLIKTTCLLNAAGYAEKITSVFTDGTEIIDELKYNSGNQVIELSNSFFKDNLKLFYKNNVFDSVSKVRTLPNGSTQSGFFKKVDAEKMISIFPYDISKAYSKSTTIGNSCTSGGSFPANTNDFNKSVYTSIIDNSTEVGYHSENLSVDFQQRINNQYCKSFLNISLTGYQNYFEKSNDVAFQPSECSPLCGNSNLGYINIFMLIPDLVPDHRLLYALTAENEIKWVNVNPKPLSDWTIRSIRYKYEPSTK